MKIWTGRFKEERRAREREAGIGRRVYGWIGRFVRGKDRERSGRKRLGDWKDGQGEV